MTRIIGGLARGRQLKAPSGSATRPTSDRVREALFSSIEAAVGSLAGVRFLDLYAGSGAVGLEALSRGAAAATLVENDRRTAGLIRANARSLGLPAEVVAMAVSRFLAEPPADAYDVAFLDPPYTLSDARVGADLAALSGEGWLAPGALVVVERSSRSAAPTWPEALRGDRSRKYGETMLWYGRAASRGEPPAGRPTTDLEET